jgi:hypothetical protein
MKNFKLFVEELEYISEEDITESELMLEKNKPTSPEKWARAKSAAKSKFAVYPSAYANAWASKKYKAMGGGWRATKEEVEYEEVEELFDIIEEVVENMSYEWNVDAETIWESIEEVTDEELYETAAWRRKEGKNPTGGLNAKGIASYRRENPGSKLKRAVTGKVKPGSKAAKRRKSFCARMGGMKGAMKKPNGEPTRKALALRKWKCR